jgi:2-methylaconitate cis-trans-isomerase PrpF
MLPARPSAPAARLPRVACNDGEVETTFEPAASRIPGSVAERIAATSPDALRIAHPLGVMDVLVEIDAGNDLRFRNPGFIRTARR